MHMFNVPQQGSFIIKRSFTIFLLTFKIFNTLMSLHVFKQLTFIQIFLCTILPSTKYVLLLFLSLNYFWFWNKSIFENVSVFMSSQITIPCRFMITKLALVPRIDWSVTQHVIFKTISCNFFTTNLTFNFSNMKT